MDTLGIEPRAFRMRSGCDTTTPCALDILPGNMCGPNCSCTYRPNLERSGSNWIRKVELDNSRGTIAYLVAPRSQSAKDAGSMPGGGISNVYELVVKYDEDQIWGLILCAEHWSSPGSLTSHTLTDVNSCHASSNSGAWFRSRDLWVMSPTR